MGVGQQKTPKAFVNACNVFIYTENLSPKEQPRTRRASPHQKEEVREDREKKSDPIPLLKQAFDMAVRDDGWAKLAQIGLYLQQLDPGFDPRTYGFKQLSSMIKGHARIFEISYQDKNGPTTVYVKLRE
jgi:hypothetical protein